MECTVKHGHVQTLKLMLALPLALSELQQAMPIVDQETSGANKTQ